MAKTVIIIGAGWAGLPLAHKLLKYTVPKMPDLKVVLVSPNSHFFWNVAATRGIIPGEIADEDLFIPIAPVFEKYGETNFEFVLGAATGISPSLNSINVGMTDGTQRTLAYDQLVIASGSRIKSNLPFKLLQSHNETISAWHDLQTKVGNASSIVIAGAGPTGIEVAGELGAKYGRKKKITLIASQPEFLPDASPSVQSTIMKDLKKLGVNTMMGTKVKDATQSQITSKWTIETSGAPNSTIEADLYLPLHGVVVNTSFVPEDLLDKSGNLNLQGDFRVAGTSNIWGIGDVGNLEPKQVTVTDAQIIHLANALDTVLTTSNSITPYKKMDKTMIFVSMGRSHATGQIGNWTLWGFMVNYVKGRKLFMDTAKGYVGGEHLRHAKM
ncbi:hypothetical protein B0I35DRAFT_488738 [Stachybotrys elegans]|uniref:FAD/NAD(P)-binding domain-containing protein n=1 Tax=Stachybotrys elegans TaxID=80388 RepID=A0A8K0WPN2_9HYPO|nr:hypothetical protein B0I35DRAFT_488738 [Stachybotrys elegans]